MINIFSRGRGRPRLDISEILRGCDVGRMQSVGIMQVLPLVSDLDDVRVVAPMETVVGTTGYGELWFDNRSDGLVLVPSQSAYVVKAAAQDHALPSAAFVKPKSQRAYRKAMCVQEGQGGLIQAMQRKLAILPLPLRRSALARRNEKSYSRLWGDLRQFKKAGGLSGAGNLVDFLDHFRDELDQFVAEFEIVPRQVGAIVLIGGEVVGVERAPSHAYWTAVWEALIRTCYGAFAVTVSRHAAKVPDTRLPLRARKARSLEELEFMLRETERAEDEAARGKIRELIHAPFDSDREETVGELAIDTVRNAQFEGQVVRDGQSVLYASLAAHADGRFRAQWDAARPFAV